MKRLTRHSTWWHTVPHREITRSLSQGEGASQDHIGIDVHKRESQI
jgi:hypothetical protein